MRKYIDIISEAVGGGLRLKDLVEAKTDFPEADFWIARRGSLETVGKPTREFSPEHIGVRVTTDQLDSRYLFYLVEYMWMEGVFKRVATGTTKLVNIKIRDVLNIAVQPL